MKKPKLYSLWFSDYESSSSWDFTHPNRKSVTTFKKDCQLVLRAFLDEYVNGYESFIGAYELITLIADNLHTRGYIPLTDIFETILVGFGGTPIIRDNNFNDGTNEIRELLGPELLKNVYKHNEKIEKSIE
jgi:hypothetical protein